MYEMVQPWANALPLRPVLTQQTSLRLTQDIMVIFGVIVTHRLLRYLSVNVLADLN